MRNSFILLLTVLFIVSCTTYRPIKTQSSNLTPGMIQQNLKKGITTSAEVRKILGPPNMIEYNRKGNLIWSYSRISSYKAGTSSSAAGGFIFFGVGSSSYSEGSTTRVLDLVIEFEKKGNLWIVKDYNFVQSAY